MSPMALMTSTRGSAIGGRGGGTERWSTAAGVGARGGAAAWSPSGGTEVGRSEEHTSELQSLMRISYAVFCLKKKQNNETTRHILLNSLQPYYALLQSSSSDK